MPGDMFWVFFVKQPMEMHWSDVVTIYNIKLQFKHQILVSNQGHWPKQEAQMKLVAVSNANLLT
jgi:hypothetical protein